MASIEPRHVVRKARATDPPKTRTGPAEHAPPGPSASCDLPPDYGAQVMLPLRATDSLFGIGKVAIGLLPRSRPSSLRMPSMRKST